MGTCMLPPKFEQVHVFTMFLLLFSYCRSPGPESPQLTIFYAGKMLVFDAFPPEKATEVMEMATKLASDNSGTEESPPSAPVATEKLAVSKVPQTNTFSETPKAGNQGVGSGN